MIGTGGGFEKSQFGVENKWRLQFFHKPGQCSRVKLQEDNHTDTTSLGLTTQQIMVGKTGPCLPIFPTKTVIHMGNLRDEHSTVCTRNGTK